MTNRNNSHSKPARPTRRLYKEIRRTKLGLSKLKVTIYMSMVRGSGASRYYRIAAPIAELVCTFIN